MSGEWVGRSIDGRFSLLKWLGGTQESGVYLTELREPSQKAIIKLVRADSKDAEIRMTAWLAAANLSHSNLIRVFEKGRCEIDSVSLLYVVTELADEVLAEIIPERALTPQEALEMLGPTLDALAYLHRNGFIHGRLKPSNVMAVGDRLKLSADDLLLEGAIGTPSWEPTVYDAPETVQGRIGTATDVWSLGAMLVAVLTQHPLEWDRAANVEPVVPESIPEPFATVARECLRADPARRCTLEEIKTRLLPGTIPPRPSGKAGEMSGAKRRVAALIAVVAVLLVGIGIWNLVSRRSQSPPPAPENQNVQATSSASAPPMAAAPVPSPAPSATPPQAQNAQGPKPMGTTVKATVTQRVDPDTLASAMSTISGTVRVTVRIAVDADGNVTGAAFESAGPSKYFANRALGAARNWKFKPAQVDGRAVPSAWLLHFQFRKSGIDITPTETAP